VAVCGRVRAGPVRARDPRLLAQEAILTAWQLGLLALALLVVVYAGFLGLLIVAGRRQEARALATFVPDCVVLFRRLLGDSRIPRRAKLLLVALVAYLAMPLDIVPDFIPVAGQLDDAIIVALVLRTVLRATGADLIREHWPGPDASLDRLLRLAGRPAGG
jgi:uncharacterized membrane protein YkvA (DUF1232 family)